MRFAMDIRGFRPWGRGGMKGHGTPNVTLGVLSLSCLVAALISPSLLCPGPLADKLPVVASILPLGDFCNQIGGDRVEVQVLVPPGASPHTFEPSPSLVARAAQARVFVYIGAGMEPWAERLLASKGAPHLAVVEATHGVSLIQEVEAHAHEEKAQSGHLLGKEAQERSTGIVPGEKADHHHGVGNPHVWLDPVIAQDISRSICRAFIQVDPEHETFYQGNLSRFLGQLQELHRDIEKSVSGFKIREYVCFHPAWTYFSNRYGLREVGVIEPSPGREPAPRHIQRIVNAIRKYKIEVIFAEPQLSPRVAEVIAKEAGVKVLMLDPLGGRPPYGSDYLKMMRYNLSALEKAMGKK